MDQLYFGHYLSVIHTLLHSPSYARPVRVFDEKSVRDHAPKYIVKTSDFCPFARETKKKNPQVRKPWVAISLAAKKCPPSLNPENSNHRSLDHILLEQPV